MRDLSRLWWMRLNRMHISVPYTNPAVFLGVQSVPPDEKGISHVTVLALHVIIVYSVQVQQ